MSVIQTVREYELHELIGGGGMGEVYRARHVLLDQAYAIKVVLPTLVESAEIRARFVREAQTLQRLDHPNILRFVTLFEDAGRLFLVTELLAGKPLDQHVQEGADLVQKTDWFHQTVRGVAHAHRRGVLHRDLKPGNLHVLPEGRVKILDFGIARPVAARAITAMGHLVGTPVYLPPEILLGDTASSAAGPSWDVYTLGLLAYELFTGRLPFDLDPNAPPLQLLNDLSRFYAKRSRGPELRTQVPELTPAWALAIDKALAIDPNKRLPDAGALLRLLDEAPPLAAQETQIVSVNTENLAPEDATRIHVIRNLRPKAGSSAAPPPVAPPAPGPAPGPPAGPAAMDPEPSAATTFPTRPRAVSADDTLTVDRRERLPVWLLPAGGAFAAGLLVAVFFRSGGSPPAGGESPAVGVAAAASNRAAPLAVAPVSASPGSASDAGEAAPGVAAALASAAAPGSEVAAAAPGSEVAVAPGSEVATAPEADAGALDFDPVVVATRPRAPRSTPARDAVREPAREAARDAARTPGAQNSTVRESGTLNNVPTHGVLSVTATPAALVYVDDTFVSESPVRGRLIKPGRHQIKLVRKELPRPYRRTIEVNIRAGHRTEVRHDEPAPKRR